MTCCKHLFEIINKMLSIQNLSYILKKLVHFFGFEKQHFQQISTCHTFIQVKNNMECGDADLESCGKQLPYAQFTSLPQELKITEKDVSYFSFYKNYN